MMADQKDYNLVVRLCRGDSLAFERIFSKYGRKLNNFANRLLYSPLESEGVVQDTFIVLWENRTSIDPAKSLRGYLFQIARNKIYNVLKVRINEPYYRECLMEYAQKIGNSLEENLGRKEMLQIYHNLIDKLPARRREIFLLSCDEGLTYREIAHKLKSYRFTGTFENESLELALEALKLATPFEYSIE